MTATKPSPHWLDTLLGACTASEQQAIKTYRHTIGKSHHRHRNGQLTRDQITHIWVKHLGLLEAEACGTPRFDQYVKKQTYHLEQWVTGEATSGSGKAPR